MSWVRFPSPAPMLSPNSGDWFCRWFCTLCSPFGLVELCNDRLRGCGPPHVAANNSGQVIFPPAHDLGDDALGEPRDIEARGGCPSQIIEMQLARRHAGGDLRLIETMSQTRRASMA